ncbi:MAG: sigma-70 family RNA polymerase sigma factor [Sandaracinaceae bacterium]|nr:sigma-70 family RNA polymerase sigma factor [Sandaracinaceae bacterium]MDW8245545.1 sigma-70 family RNA polymerase sigma factor [Sandaracinaceae bacterium]
MSNQFEKIYYQERDGLRAFLSRKVPFAEVDDLMADVFIAFHERSSKMPIENPKAYLYGIAHRLVLKYYERKAKEEGMAQFDSAVHGVNHLGRLSSQIDYKDRINKVLWGLPIDYQNVFEMRYISKLKIEDIVEATGISRATVNRYLKEVRKKLEEAFPDLELPPDKQIEDNE